MNKELYLNETTKVGVVVQDENELKTVESNENEDTVKILSLQNDIEEENEHVTMLEDALSDFIGYNFCKILMYVCSIMNFCLDVDLAFYINKHGWRLFPSIYLIIVSVSILTVACYLYGSLLGTFKQNNARIKELSKEIEKSDDKIKILEEELKNLKEKSNYNEDELTNEDVIKLATVNYPERTNNETLVSDIQLPAKIKKITFNHNGTTK